MGAILESGGTWEARGSYCRRAAPEHQEQGKRDSVGVRAYWAGVSEGWSQVPCRALVSQPEVGGAGEHSCAEGWLMGAALGAVALTSSQ